MTEQILTGSKRKRDKYGRFACETIEMVGQRFGRYTVLAEMEKRGTQLLYKCECDCGNIRIVYGGNLKSGHSQSCGCRNKEIITTHGKSKTIEYCAWLDMKQRCTDQNQKRYCDYGGRGITICEKWLNSFETFYKDMGKRPAHCHSLDRMDNEGNYNKDNCQWATRTTQQHNSRLFITNTSGVKGVHLNKKGKYEAYINAANKKIGLGHFSTLEEATIARKNGEQKYWGK